MGIKNAEATMLSAVIPAWIVFRTPRIYGENGREQGEVKIFFELPMIIYIAEVGLDEDGVDHATLDHADEGVIIARVAENG